MGKLRLARLTLYMGLVCAGLIAPLHVSAQDVTPGGAFILEIDGAIDPNRAKFLKRGLKRAQDEGGQFVIIVIDTPGGLVSSMQDMVQSIFASTIPAITFVAPQGARAASAGTFITAAGHVAVMAPSTNIGAATPIGGGGEDLPETLASKALNDAAAEIRGIAERRGRNIEKLEETVREASSFTSREALELNMIDLIADDLPDLLAKLDGRVVNLDRADVVLETEGIRCVKPRALCTSVSPSFVENFLSVIADPNISALLLSLGGLALFVEILNPGLIFPGVFGAIALTLAFVALGNLPVNYAGVGLILFAIVLLFFELHAGGSGILGVGALVAFILGGPVPLFAVRGRPSLHLGASHQGQSLAHRGLQRRHGRGHRGGRLARLAREAACPEGGAARRRREKRESHRGVEPGRGGPRRRQRLDGGGGRTP